MEWLRNTIRSIYEYTLAESGYCWVCYGICGPGGGWGGGDLTRILVKEEREKGEVSQVEAVEGTSGIGRADRLGPLSQNFHFHQPAGLEGGGESAHSRTRSVFL